MGSKNNPGKFDCIAKAEPDEPMFVLLGRDPAAPLTIAFWIGIRKWSGKNEPDVLGEAASCASAMMQWAKKLGKDLQRAGKASIRLYEEVGLRSLLSRGRDIWGDEKLDAAGVLVRLVVDVGKLARYVRGATKDRCPECHGTGYEGVPPMPVFEVERDHTRCTACRGTGMTLDLRLIMGNILFSVIRWCDDLGLDPAECVRLAEEQQRRFAQENHER